MASHRVGPPRHACAIIPSQPRRKPHKMQSTIIEKPQPPQLLNGLLRQTCWFVTPFPISTYRARQIHSRVTAKTQYILQRNDGDVCHGCEHRTNEHPVDRLVLKSQVCPGEVVLLADIFCGSSALADARTAPPSNRRVVVVSTRVRHKFARIIVRTEARPLWIASEGKLKEAHAGEAKLLAKCFYFGSNHTKVFSNEWKFFQFSLQSLEKLCTGALYPLASGRGRSVRWDLPIRFETAEVIQPYQVEQFERCADAINPPPVTRHRRHIPPIERVSPKLTGGAEIVRRNACNGAGLALLIQTEQLGM